MRRSTCVLLAVILLFTVSPSCFAENPDELVHNYILIIDNSLSTTGTHSLGEATDPEGLRFDAARLVYENVLSSARAGTRGKICVITFCGPDNCETYGPMDIGADKEALDQAIGTYLSESSQHARDQYTDIRTALGNALGILAGFEGDSSVILLTDGINDLTNDPDPFSQPVNIEANDRTVETIEQIRGLGADFYVVALTARDSVKNTDAFMEFIDRMALAGGGTRTPDGACSNVLMATQADLNSKLLQILIKAEVSDEVGIQASSHKEDRVSTFQVPYEGIRGATVNITFMPGEKEKIRGITLEAPDKTSRTIYENGALRPVEGITIKDDRSYIILDIPSPQPGEWKLTVDSAGEAEVDSVIRFNQTFRIRTELPKSAAAGESFPLFAWVQQYDGEQYADVGDSDFYELSSATMILYAPGNHGKTDSLALEKVGDCFGAEISLELPGVWTLEFQVSNDYWSDTLGSAAIRILSPEGEGGSDPGAPRPGEGGSDPGAPRPGGGSDPGTPRPMDVESASVQPRPGTGISPGSLKPTRIRTQ